MTPEQKDKVMALADAYANQLGALCAVAMGSPAPELLTEAMRKHATDRAALHDYLLSTCKGSLNAHLIYTSPERVQKSGNIEHIGCVQHDCAECRAREAQSKPEPLTDKRIRELQAQYPSDNDPMLFAYAIELELLK